MDIISYTVVILYLLFCINIILLKVIGKIKNDTQKIKDQTAKINLEIMRVKQYTAKVNQEIKEIKQRTAYIRQQTALLRQQIKQFEIKRSHTAIAA
jgi:F0F1-type ATP synthase membrane subunit b/b'